jgi:hypothetical protein
MFKFKIIPVLLISYLYCVNCGGVPSQQTPNTNDPIEFARPFRAVCKVGINGGDGTLIDNKWVLTAGHVAEGMYRKTEGKLSVYFDNESAYVVKQVFLHPDYVPMGLNDIALLELQTPVRGIDPIHINTDTNELNKEIILAGHGDKRNSDGTWIKDGKLRAYTNIVDRVNDTHIEFDYDSPAENATIREGTSGPGDSGGPALLKSGNEYYVAGISSMGEPGRNGPASYGAIEHFVRVAKFEKWIHEILAHPFPDYAFSMLKSNLLYPDKNETVSLPDQEYFAQVIINALSNYTEEKMIDAINQSYDPSVLSKRSPSEIIRNMPALITELQHAKLKEILNRSPDKISYKLLKGDNEYVLDIFFNELSKKIQQLGFARVN